MQDARQLQLATARWSLKQTTTHSDLLVFLSSIEWRRDDASESLHSGIVVYLRQGSKSSLHNANVIAAWCDFLRHATPKAQLRVLRSQPTQSVRYCLQPQVL